MFVSPYCQASMNLTGNDQESLVLAFHHQGSMFINAKKKEKKKQAAAKMVIETEGNMGLMISAKTLNHV